MNYKKYLCYFIESVQTERIKVFSYVAHSETSALVLSTFSFWITLGSCPFNSQHGKITPAEYKHRLNSPGGGR